MPPIAITLKTIGLLLLGASSLFADLISETSSMKDFQTGTQKLTVYTDVPGNGVSVINGYPSRAKSNIYEIRVRSAASNYPGAPDDGWVQCFANMTYNRGLEMPPNPAFATGTSTHGYQTFTSGWTHTYANIEMSTNSPVEVEIRKIGSTLLNSSNVIVKSAVHPALKVSSHSTHLGRVYFTITNPSQVVIDINGQMDDHNAAFPSGTTGGAMPGNPPVHSLALYANPIMAKPVAGPTTVTVTPGQSTPTQRLPQPVSSTYTTLVFAPGVHFIGPGFKVYPGKSYYIPGDAIVYGNIGNIDVSSTGYRCNGDRINIFGYGSICSIQIPQRNNSDANPQYPEWNEWKASLNFIDQNEGIEIENAWDTKITGVSVIDPAGFNTRFDRFPGRTNDQCLVSWVKLHSWRVNGDGFGGNSAVEDSFIRACDDSTYVQSWRRRCTWWKDTNANIFRFINYSGGGVEDCDVLYARWRSTTGVGSVFEFVNYQGSEAPNLMVRNIRFHDKLSNPTRMINLGGTTDTFSNLKFENISFYTPLNNRLSIIGGSATAPYTGAVMFKNVTFQNGLNGSSPIKLTQINYGDYFETSEFVDPSIFEPPSFTLGTNASNGSITLNPPGGTYISGTQVIATAIANSGYQFTGWSGNASGSINPLTVAMTANKTLTANFALITASSIHFTTVGTNDWVCPAGVTNINVECWGGGGAAGSASSIATGNTQARSGGGAGGSYAKIVNFVVTPGATYKIIVGAGGIPVTSVTTHNQAEPGQAGGESKFMDAALTTEFVKAVGGAGGRNALKTSGTVNVSGGVGSTTGCLGDVVFAGGSGGNAGATEAGGTGSGGGGGGAGDAGPGGSPTFAITAGTGGVSGGGNGGVGRGAVGPPQILPTAPGGGGGGVVVATSGSTNVGAAGGDGKVIIIYNPVMFTLNTQAVNGGITLSPAGGSYPAGTAATVTASPDAGYRFSGWSGDLAGSEISPVIVMNANKSISANFELIIPALSVRLDGSEFMMSWPLTSPGWTLEWSTSLEPESWSEVPPPYSTNATEFFWQETMPLDKCFFRLRRP